MPAEAHIRVASIPVVQLPVEAYIRAADIFEGQSSVAVCEQSQSVVLSVLLFAGHVSTQSPQPVQSSGATWIVNFCPLKSGIFASADLNPSGAFSRCTNLITVVIPAGVTNIENMAFAGCAGLTNVEIGAGVAGVEGFAFIDCTNLLAFAVGDFLDALGTASVLGNIPRLGAVAASTTILFTLSAAQPGAVIIPAGTRVSCGAVMFALALKR